GEARQRAEHLGVALGDRLDGGDRGARRAVEAVLALVLGRADGQERELGVVGADGDREEVDEVAVDHQAPGAAVLAAARVVAEELEELARDVAVLDPGSLVGGRSDALYD